MHFVEKEPAQKRIDLDEKLKERIQEKLLFGLEKI